MSICHKKYSTTRERECDIKLFIGRGYCGHEHLCQFGLVNMNARLYDPAVGRFLSPDPFVQAPEMSQNFNRYSYALNNPLRYTDKSGEIVMWPTFWKAMWEASMNLGSHGLNFNEYTWDGTMNAWEIDKGMFTGSRNEVFLKWTWSLPQSVVGYAIAHTLNLFGCVTNVTHQDGMVAIGSTIPDEAAAMTVEHYSIGEPGYTATWMDNLWVHEYGHYLQSQDLGPVYLLKIGIPSLRSAWYEYKTTGIPHYGRWFEVDATRRGILFMEQNYGINSSWHKIYPNFFYFDRDFMYRGQTPYPCPRPIHEKHMWPVDADKFYQDTKGGNKNGKKTIWDFIGL